MTPASVSKPPHDARRVFLACVALTIAAIVGQTWWAIVQDRTLTIEQENRNALVAVRSIEEHADRTINDAERAVGAVIDTIGASGVDVTANDGALRDILIRQRQEVSHIPSLRFIDRRGLSSVTTFAYPAPVIDVSDRFYVKQLAAHENSEQNVVGHPVDSRYDHKWVLPIARNLLDKDQQRVGSIAAYISVMYFSQFYDRIAKDTHAVVSLHTSDGFLIVQSPYKPELIGTDVSAWPMLQHIPAGSVEGLLVSPRSAASQQPALNAYRRVGTSPVIAVYSRDMSDLLADWRLRNVNRITFAGMTIVLIGILTYFLLMHIARLHRSEKRLTASETRYRALYESATDGIMLINRARRFVDCNPAALEMFGATSVAQIRGKSVDEFGPVQRLASSARSNMRRMLDAAFAGQPQFFEWQSHRYGVAVCDEVSLSLATVEDVPMLFCIFRDITQRKAATVLQEGQNQILHLIGTDAELARILKEIASFIERAAPHAHCLLLTVSDDQGHFTGSFGHGATLALSERLMGSKIGDGMGAISEAVVTKCPVVVTDILLDPVLGRLLHPPGAHSDGGEDSGKDGDSNGTTYRASSSWPIMSKRGQILGVFSMFYQDAGTPSSADMTLVGIGTDLAGIAIEGKIADDTIRHLAHHDELTGLPNRFLYTQHLEKALAHSERTNAPAAVLFLDLDRFKHINDSFGHVAGDGVLRTISERFTRCLRSIDILARVGGDEFIVLVDDFSTPHQLGEIAQRLMHEATQPFEIDGQECQISVSIGIATYPLDGADARTLLKHADIAMYRAKATGKNNYQFYSATMNTHTVDRLALETRLRRAIERNEFVVHYQPKIDIETGLVAGAEALVRWMHPERGLLYPGAFIELAEEAGLIGAIGLQVIDRTCAGIRRFDEAGVHFGRVAINLSARQFSETALLNDVARIVAQHDVTPSRLEFEITESMVMNNREEAIGLMDRMRELGYTLSIDDFGTGYSSLAYLKRFPVDSVKVDKSFINDIPHDANDSAIVQAIIVMAHTLGLKVTAEGVETATQLDILRGFGCDEYQGYYYSKAVPEVEFIALLQRQNALAAV